MQEAIYKNLIERIEIDPEKLGGKPLITGTRIAVEQVLRMLGAGLNAQEILADLPQLKEQDILATLVYASSLVEDFRAYPRVYLKQIKVSV